jgi:hypothetical protein
MRVDPNNTWRRVEERLGSESDPRRRRNLETVLAHMKAETVGDLDGLMATVSTKREPHYHAYGTDDPILSPKGRDAVRQFYSAFVASGAVKLELDVDRLIVDDDAVVTEGLMKIAYPGQLLRLMGHEVPDAEASYLFRTRMCIVWPRRLRRDRGAQARAGRHRAYGHGLDGCLATPSLRCRTAGSASASRPG